MSVVVRMEMPTKDRMCQMADDIDGVWYCPVMKKLCRQPDNGEMPSWCPIICQLPEGHGRLIDASTIIGEVDAGYTDDYGNPIPANRPISVDEYLGLEVPTIVPAERSEP